MAEIIGVKFKPAGKIYFFDPQEFDIKKGDHVIVETSRGAEYGTVAAGRRTLVQKELNKPLKSVTRMATEEDDRFYHENKKLEKEAFAICIEKIALHGLAMKLVEVEYTFDRSKILFYFTADGRIDFRELVKDLASVFHTRIELRQIGVRDESKTIGSVGICGRSLCCSCFLDDFAPVSIKMAKEQGLSLNPTKLSGACGRLMCCLKYEQDVYEELNAVTPQAGSVVKTPSGTGTVIAVNLLRGICKVQLEGSDRTTKEFNVNDLKILKRASSSSEHSDGSNKYF